MIAVKICGLRDADAVGASILGGAAMCGFVFYPPSPRAVTANVAASLMHAIPAHVRKVGLFVNAGDDEIAHILATTSIDTLQLHGDETPQRVAAIRARFAKPVIKAMRVAAAEDLDPAATHAEVADWLLFDARVGGTYGGSGRNFDWRILAGRTFARPWLLAGGLNATNTADAVRTTGARVIDVSSGVEAAPGQKDPAKIAELLALAAQL